MSSSFKVTMFLRSAFDHGTTVENIRRALQASPYDFLVDDMKAEPNQVSQPTPDDVPDDWAPIKRPGDFVTVTEDQFGLIIPDTRQITADLPTPAEPDSPACDLHCADCAGEPHHWLTGIDHGYVDTEPNHPAALAGFGWWDICKHCQAWRQVPDDDDEPVTKCDHPKCKGPIEIYLGRLFMDDRPRTGKFCRRHALLYGRQSAAATGQTPMIDVEVGAFKAYPELAQWIENRISATPVLKLIRCPQCKSQHVDLGEQKDIPHRTHRCLYCKHEWRPFEYCTIGVSSLISAFEIHQMSGTPQRTFNTLPKLSLVETPSEPED